MFGGNTVDGFFMLPRKGVRLDILGAWSIGYCEAEFRQKSCLSGGQSLGRVKVLKVSVISRYSKKEWTTAFEPQHHSCV